MKNELTKTQLESADYHKRIWEIDLFQTYKIDDYTGITRVPGGWMYEKLRQYPSKGGLIDLVNTVFIPYSEEFKPKKGPTVEKWFVD
jgi:hypothetical protein